MGHVIRYIFPLGNLLGPVVNTTIEGGLEKYFRQPTGCGEQTMIKLAPNVYVLEYLTNTKQLSGANEENAYRFIQAGMFSYVVLNGRRLLFSNVFFSFYGLITGQTL